MKIIISALIILASSYVSPAAGLCADINNTSKQSGKSGELQAPVYEISDANNRFAFELYSRYGASEGNIFFSPYSISTIFDMAYEGARGKTAEEIRKVFHIPEDISVTRRAHLKIFNNLCGENKKYELRIANALWAENSFPFLKSYFNLVKKYYDGETANLDFINESGGSRIIMNYWTEEQTGKKIKDLIPKGNIDSTTRMVITNAVYFKGSWENRFNRKNTKMVDFSTGGGKSVRTPMMSLKGNSAVFNYAETETLQILELPYSGKELSAIILLPKNKDLSALEESLTVEEFNKLRKALKKSAGDVYMPKFKFVSKYFMSGTLKKMGIPEAFSLDADFSGMTGNDDLFISEVVHQAYVEINEEGTESTEGRAAGLLEKPITDIPVKQSFVFNANHPFIFIILEKENGNILFLGRVVKPNQ